MNADTVEIRAYSREGSVLGSKVIPVDRDEEVTVTLVEAGEHQSLVVEYATAVISGVEFLWGNSGPHEIARGGHYMVRIVPHLIRHASMLGRPPVDVIDGQVVETKRPKSIVV